MSDSNKEILAASGYKEFVYLGSRVNDEEFPPGINKKEIAYREEHPNEIREYDVFKDNYRTVSQKDYDLMLKKLNDFATLRAQIRGLVFG